MKKNGYGIMAIVVLAVALATMSLLAGCSNAQSRANGGSTVSIERNGHRYLVFEFPGKYGSNVLHDPDCPRCEKTRGNR